MTIQLPVELVDVAAAAGVSWPEADEDRMRVAAQAWRDAGAKLDTVTKDADRVASTALNAVSGDTGDAARRHWSGFVAPDSGHLTATANGCVAAADRLDHAANQVSTAKLEIVRNLVSLAKNRDAANTAANAGHPTALLGLDTAVRATSANVTNITSNLVTAVVPASGVDVAAIQNPVNANPGAAGPVTAVVNGVLDPVGGAVADHVPPGRADDFVPPGRGGDVVPPGHLDPGHPEITGPVRIDPVDNGPPTDPRLSFDAPTPPTGQTVQAGLAGAVLDAPAPAAPAPGSVGAAPGPAAPGGGPAPVPAPAAPGVPGVPPAPAAPIQAPGAAAGAVARPVAPPPAGIAVPAPSAQPVADVPRGRGAQTTAVPPGPPPPAPQVAVPAAPPQQREEGGVLFWVHMFPFGHMPVRSEEPARQLPPPPEEVDYAAGLRFPPGDHPQHDQIRTAIAEVPATEGLPAEHPAVAGLTIWWDALGGQHERDWDRRFLVRPGTVTSQGISNEGKEYAWPPGESYPEGGTAPGEPELLAEGTVIDRFGPPGGRLFAADATPFERRSLPPESLAAGYFRYRVERPLPVWRTVTAPWFGQQGGGERYRTTYSATELVAFGYLTDITGAAE
jgi:hypothetical protein